MKLEFGMKKLIALIIMLILCLLLIVGLNPTILYVEADGYVVPSSANISSALSKSSGDTVWLQYLQEDAMIYSSLFQDYDYETKTAIDLSYPMFVNGGAGLHFLSDDFWLISDDFDLLKTYDGLYLTDGITYNSDLSQADGAEFLLVALSDGLYINAQSAVFTNALGETAIPANSILLFTDSSVSYYSYSNGSLVAHEIQQVFGATISIGAHTYSYADFLEALGIFEDAADSIQKQSDIKELQSEIAQVLQDQNSGNATSDNEDGDAYQQLSTSGNGSDDGDDSADDSDLTTDESSEKGESDGLSSSNQSSGENDDAEDGDQEDGEESDILENDGESDGDGGSDSGADDTEGDSSSDGSTSSGSTSGTTSDPVYQIPTVSIDDVSTWAYAINGDLNISDPSALIRKGVSFTVYGSIKAISSGGSSTTVDGMTVYSADDYTGASAKLRKTYYSSQTFTLDGIQPDTDFYIQYSYSYTAEVEDENGEKVYTTIYVLSDFYLVSTKSIEESNLATMLISYDTAFASDDNSYTYEQFFIENDSAYDSEDDSFANFQLNTLPYFSKLYITLTDVNTDAEQTLTISSSNLKKAMVDGGVTYTSSSVLTSNSTYTYTFVAQDKYGNELPIEVCDFISSEDAIFETAGTGTDATFEGTVYTAKAKPTVTIDEVENITDSLTLKITVTDTNGALLEEDGVANDVWLQVTSTATVGDTLLTGTWSDGTPLASVIAEDGNQYLYLPQAKDGATYEFTLDSLAFARTYTFSVYGNYDPQPDAVSRYVDVTDEDGNTSTIVNEAQSLDIQYGATLGSDKSYTAAISAGSIDVDVATMENNISMIFDTYASLILQISHDTNYEVLALVDEFVITITDTDANTTPVSIYLQESVLSQLDINSVDADGNALYEYDADTKSVVLWYENGVTLSLEGERSEFDGVSLWEALLVTQTTDEGTGETQTKDAVSLRITIDEGMLNTYSSHTISYIANVVKSGVTYPITVSLSTSKFSTKKLTPVVGMDDAIAVSDRIDFDEFNVYDPDGAVVGTTEVELQLYSTTIDASGAVVADALLKKTSVYANSTDDVYFEGLTEGITYIIMVKAVAYNNDSGYASYTTYQTLETYAIEAGSDIKAVITINSLEYEYDERELVYSITGEQAAEQMEDWSQYSSSTNSMYTGYYSLTDDFGMNANSSINVIELDYIPGTSNALDSTMHTNIHIYFYTQNSNGSYSTTTGATTASNSYALGENVTALIPEGATHVRFMVGDMEQMAQTGFSVYGYTVDTTADLVVGVTANDRENIYINPDYGTYESLVQHDMRTYTNSTGVLSTLANYSVIYQLPVTPGDLYLAETTSMYSGAYIFYYNAQGEYVGYRTYLQENAILTIPENVYYISFTVYNTNSFQLYLLSTALGDDGEVNYYVDADITIYDKEGYLFDPANDPTGDSTVEVLLQKSELANPISDSDYNITADSGDVIQLTWDDDAGGYVGSYQDSYQTSYTQTLDTNCSYKLSVLATYGGSERTLASQTLDTDGALIIINSTSDWDQVYSHPYANFLVTSDIVVSGGEGITFYGTIDFDGHTVTQQSTSSSYLISALGTTGVLKNLVYVVDNGIVHGIVYTNYGLMENIMVKTTSETTTIASYRAFFCGNANYGTIRNFIIELGGDVILAHSNTAIAVRTNYGTLENGYIYTTNNYDLVVKDDAITRTGGLTAETATSSVIRNIYSIYDYYLNEGSNAVTTTNGYLVSNYNYGESINNIYHVGDSYVYSETLGKTTTTLTNRRMVNNVYTTGQTENIWNIAINEYEPSSTKDDTLSGTSTLLYSTSWQSQVLTSGFDIEETVSMGYYPRLELPSCMEQHQIYNPLPLASDSGTPSIIEDYFTEDSETFTNSITNDRGYITLRFENASAYTIVSVEITGLVTSVYSQQMADDGIYEVVLYAYVPSDTTAEYASAYSVTSLVYNNGSANRTDNTVTYETQNISFYKTIASVEDWFTIDTNMDWNYRLTNNIAFDEYDSLIGIRIDGSSSSEAGSKTFTGTLDGGQYDADGNVIGCYEVSGISFTDSNYPYLFYYLGTGGSITNITFTDVTLTGKSTQSATYVGLVRYAYYGSLIENVHLSDVEIDASGYVGALVGVLCGVVQNCTANDITISQKTGLHATSFGGLVGYANLATIENSYCKNLTLEVTGSTSIMGIGGLVGYANHTSIYNCYVQGSITSDGQTIGGIAGKVTSSFSTIENVISDVDINTPSGNVGGLIGSNEALVYDSISLGNIYAGNTNVHRSIGLKVRTQYYYNPTYAYAGQTVNSLTSSENDDAQYLYTAQELSSSKTWIDGMGFGSQWDYSLVSSGYMPLLYYKDSDVLLPGQEGDDALTLPGTESVSVEFMSASVEDTNYTVWVAISSDSMSGEELEAAIENKTLTFTIEGMAMTDGDYDDGNCSYTVYAHDTGIELQIVTTQFTHAYDTYKLIVEHNNTSITTIIDYGQSLYHTIQNITEWNTYMSSADHAKSSENYIIDGTIDFSNASPAYTNLLLGNLQGTDNAAFVNMAFETTSLLGGTWITSCKNISNIDFSNMQATFSTVPAYQTTANFISYVSGDITNVSLTDITITSKTSTAGAMGFFYEVTGYVSDITANNITITSTAGTSQRSYTGGIASYLYGSFGNITADNITITSAYSNYVGGLFGWVTGMWTNGIAEINENVKVSNVTVVARAHVGSLVGYGSSILSLQNIEASNIDIQANYQSGAIGGSLYFLDSGNLTTDLTVYDSSIVITAENTTSGSYVGGMFGYASQGGSTNNFYRLYVENVTVEGYGAVGGIFGGENVYCVEDVQVIDCTVTQNRSGISVEDGLYGAGGVVGYWTYSGAYLYDVTVRGTSITADYNAGGVIGRAEADDNINLSNAYVAEDVVVTATINNAGGMVGYADEFKFTNLASGAQVTAMGNNAGGLIGYVPDLRTTQTITGAYVSGTVVASNYTGGIFGYVSSGIAMTSSKLVGAIVTADLSSGSIATVDVVGNFALSSDYTSGNVGVWDNILVNGQTIQSVFHESTETASTIAMKAGVSFLTATNEPVASGDIAADAFLQTETYTTYGFTNYDSSLLVSSGTTDIADDITSNPYMPFILDTDGNVLSNTSEYQVIDSITWAADGGYTINMSTVSSSVGITRPTSGERAGATVVYVSGVDSINIETMQSSITISMTDASDTAITLSDVNTDVAALVDNSDGTYTYTFTSADRYGATNAQYYTITLGYDFQSSITVDGITYTSDDLVRSVMTYNTSWYYIDNTNTLQYGSDTSTQQTAVTGFDTSDAAIHLWQGKALTDTGLIYTPGTTAGSWVTATTSSARTNGAIQSVASPIFDGATYDVYYNYTVDSANAYYAYRVLSGTGGTYNVFSIQGALYDAYILSSVSAVNYFYLLSSETNSITRYSPTSITLDTDLVNEDIVQMSNTFGYTGSMSVVRYEDGDVKVWNFTTGDVKIDVDGVYTLGSGVVASGTNLLSGTNTTNGTGISTFSSVMTSFSTFARSYTSSVFDTSEPVTDIPTDDSYENSAIALTSYTSGSATENGLSNTATTGGSTSDDDDAENSGSAADGTGTDGTAQGVQDGVTADGAGGSEATGAAQDDALSQAQTSDLEGTADEDGTAAESGTASAQDAVDATTSTSQGGSSTTAGTASDGSDDATLADGTGNQAAEEATGADGSSNASDTADGAPAYVVAYNPYTNAYEVYDTQTVETGNVTGQSQTATVAASLAKEDTDFVVNEDADFKITTMTNSILSTDEKHGFIFLSILALCGIAVLFVLHIKYKKD